MYGELMPLGGGDPIPLLKKTLIIGRRDNCDIVLRFPNISARHCQLTLKSGYWYIQDLDSRNGIKVNGVRIAVGEKRVNPGDTVSIAKHQYEVHYDPAKLGAVGAPPPEDDPAQVFGSSLLERAGLTGRRDEDEMPEEYRRAQEEREENGPRRGKRET
jgi:adenylate cyclase